MQFPRSSGILLPVFSLPSRFGIGDFGPEARRFVDFLAAAGQTIWQILPLSPTVRGNSPYSSYSAFAGNPLFISLELLCEDGLLSTVDLDEAATPEDSPHTVNYQRVTQIRDTLLRRACDRFNQQTDSGLHSEFSAFCDSNACWLEDFTRFDAYRLHFGTDDWSQWDDDIAACDPDAVYKLDQQVADSVSYSRFLQFLFYRQWESLRDYARERNVRIYGDMPIFLAYESADVWVNQELFCLNERGQPTVVAGVPPDYFSDVGQKWGNPLYRWDRLQETGFTWWTARIRHALYCFDILRIDHFRGFESYWQIPADAETAITGEWQHGPGEGPFRAAEKVLGPLPIVAEDLGLITDAVHDLRERLGFPGMRVLQFGFHDEHDAYHRPEAFPEHSFAYTGTHDNDTVCGWYQHEIGQGNPLLQRYSGREYKELLKSVVDSAADTVILPMQDVLGLGSHTRINTPGNPDNNWLWRCSAEAVNDEVSGWLKQMTVASGRA